MNTTSNYKVKLATAAMKKGIKCGMRIRGGERYEVTNIRNHNHTIILTTDEGTYVAVDPEDILFVWVAEMPPSMDPDA